MTDWTKVKTNALLAGAILGGLIFVISLILLILHQKNITTEFNGYNADLYYCLQLIAGLTMLIGCGIVGYDLYNLKENDK